MFVMTPSRAIIFNTAMLAAIAWLVFVSGVTASDVLEDASLSDAEGILPRAELSLIVRNLTPAKRIELRKLRRRLVRLQADLQLRRDSVEEAENVLFSRTHLFHKSLNQLRKLEACIQKYDSPPAECEYAWFRRRNEKKCANLKAIKNCGDRKVLEKTLKARSNAMDRAKKNLKEELARYKKILVSIREVKEEIRHLLEMSKPKPSSGPRASNGKYSRKW